MLTVNGLDILYFYELVEHPILSHAKLIAESWDLGGYFVGAMPSGWSEWNGAYRDTVRCFIRGDFGQVPELIKRFWKCRYFPFK